MNKIGTAEKKLRFIELRAAGKSYRTIAAEMHVSKDTLRLWNAELAGEVKDAQAGRLAELLTAYEMDREARIKRLGETIKKMDAAAAKINYREIDPVKLLQLRLTYIDALKAESGEAAAAAGDGTTRDELEALKEKVKAGTATVNDAEQAAAIAARFGESDDKLYGVGMDDFIRIREILSGVQSVIG